MAVLVHVCLLSLPACCLQACGDASVYCPLGSSVPRLVLNGSYSSGGTVLTRTDTLTCPTGAFCTLGVLVCACCVLALCTLSHMLLCCARRCVLLAHTLLKLSETRHAVSHVQLATTVRQALCHQCYNVATHQCIVQAALGCRSVLMRATIVLVAAVCSHARARCCVRAQMRMVGCQHTVLVMG